MIACVTMTLITQVDEVVELGSASVGAIAGGLIGAAAR